MGLAIPAGTALQSLLGQRSVWSSSRPRLHDDCPHLPGAPTFQPWPTIGNMSHAAHVWHIRGKPEHGFVVGGVCVVGVVGSVELKHGLLAEMELRAAGL